MSIKNTSLAIAGVGNFKDLKRDSFEIDFDSSLSTL